MFGSVQSSRVARGAYCSMVCNPYGLQGLQSQARSSDNTADYVVKNCSQNFNLTKSTQRAIIRAYQTEQRQIADVWFGAILTGCTRCFTDTARADL